MVSFSFALLLALAAYPLLAPLAGTRRRAVRSCVAVFAVGWLFGFVLHAARQPPLPETRPVARRDNGYLGSGSCRACHPGNYRTWHASYHRTMTQVAGPESIEAPFEGQTVTVDGREYQFERIGDEFWATFEQVVPGGTTRNPAQQRVRRRIRLTTGSHHYQVYWYSTGDDRRLANLPIVYLLDEQRWIPRASSFVLPTLCLTREYSQPPDTEWNMGCIRCHATQGEPGAAENSRQLWTQVVDFGISCEACHGPGEEHIRANQNPLRRYQLRDSQEPDPTIVNPARLSHRRSTEVCGQCHAVQEAKNSTELRKWMEGGYSYRPGDELAETRVIISPRNYDAEVLQSTLYSDPEQLKSQFWSDGMVRVAGREYNGLLETACYQRGEMSCLSCHDLHQDREDTRPITEWANDQLSHHQQGNAACVQCHQSIAEQLESHTHHAADSSGSLCYNCHMPHTAYGLLTAMRSHQVTNPRVSTTLETGRPNACNLCHLDQTLGWTADYLVQWYGHDRPLLSEDQEQTAASLLWMLEGNAAQRALLAWGFGWKPAQDVSGNDWIAPFVAVLLEDPYDAVRQIAHRTLAELPGMQDFDYDFLADPEALAAARQRAVARWENEAQRNRGRSPLAWPSRLLLNPDGKLRVADLQRLLERRNDEPLILAE